MPGLLGSLVLVVVATLVIWKGSGYFEQAAERLSKHYGLPVAVHGAIVVAIGSSFPEISSIVISTVVHGEFSLGVGAIVGSAIFNLLVIPALSALSSEELEATRDLIHKDAQFYVISVLVLFITFALGATYVPGGTNRAAILTPPLALLSLATYGIYVFLHQQDASEHVADDSLDVRPAREWGALVVGLLVITVGVEGIVRAALSLGAIFDTPSFLWGLTVIAAGTSLPDAFVSVRAAQNDDSVTSLTNVLGSNTFNLLVAIPVGVLLAGSATINFLAAIPTMGFLAFATLVFIVFTRTHLELTNREAYGFLGLYGLFLLWMILESMGVIETVQGI
ncbi:sodium/calcium exchanger membrane region (plasmid) [Haloterrigena turkmenica DSM 5511]|uniref:Sodium/calcium exchanger membrane region n=1 Tax=Haloterrigena turkmenica (strain ATCC 51198 / DSM 5511 / JCM 9101 / NCIMB 13204 / VKM B-1734 / 4k) TaxID=543526 RepID=D2S0H7_HALTV|nr:sodium:calcium antiporter [Haloterrigena turkmenica]ADB62874.1 sodium/calcium exchanger membrane region [Haloterrigena turkmenica DSM 5511]